MYAMPTNKLPKIKRRPTIYEGRLILPIDHINQSSPQGRPLPRFAKPAAAASGILVLAALGIDGIPPPVLTGGIVEGTLPAVAALGNGGGKLTGLPVETDEGTPLPIDDVDTPEPGLLPTDGGKLFKLGNFPTVLLSAVSLI